MTKKNTTFVQFFYYSITMKRIYFLLALVLITASCGRRLEISSPDKDITVAFRLSEKGTPEYCALHNLDTVINWSELGLVCDSLDLSQGFEKKGKQIVRSHSKWETVWGEEHFIVDNYRELTVFLRHESGIRMNMRFANLSFS